MIRHMPEEKGLMPIIIEPTQEPSQRYSPVIEQRRKGRNGVQQALDNMRKVAGTERDWTIWELLSRGYTKQQICDEMGLTRPTVTRAINNILESTEALIAQSADDYRTRQLGIYAQEIRRASKDADTEPVPLLNPDGTQAVAQNGRLKWEISPMEAAKIRDFGGRRLIQALKEEARLMGLLIQRHEVEVNQRILAIVRSESGESIIDMV